MEETTVACGIVLKSIPYRENDAILTVYFKEFGKLSIIALGIRKAKSKNASACQMLCYSEFTFFLRKGLSRLVKASIINAYRYLEQQIDSQACATFICEYYYRAVAENQPDLKAYHFLMKSLEKLNQGYPPVLIYLLAMAYILKDSGSAIMVDHCVHCDSTKIVSISILDGGFLCAQHANEESYYPIEVLRCFRYINRLDIDDIDQFDFSKATIAEVRRLMEAFFEEYSPLRLASQKFMK